jgi:hypothetical protein
MLTFFDNESKTSLHHDEESTPMLLLNINFTLSLKELVIVVNIKIH